MIVVVAAAVLVFVVVVLVLVLVLFPSSFCTLFTMASYHEV